MTSRSFLGAVMLGLSITAAQAADPVKIGWLGALSGVLAPYGTEHKRGMEFAVEKINSAGGVNGAPIEVIYVDSKFDIGFAVQSVQRFALQDKVSAIIGDISSAVTIAEVQATARHKVPQITALGGSTKVTELGSRYIFRSYPSVALTYGAMAAYASREMGLSRFATIAYDDEGGISSKDAFIAGLKEEGAGTIVADEIVPIDTKDFRSVLTRLREAGPDALVLAAAAPVSGLIARQVRELGWDVQLLGHGGYHAVPEFQAVAGDAAEGMYLTVTYAPGLFENEEAVSFLEEWKAAHNSEPTDMEAHGYDAMMLVADAIGKAGTEREAIRDQLAATSNWKGAAGSYTLLENGDLDKTLIVQKWENGKLVPVTVFER